MANSAQPVCVLALQRRNKSELGPLRTATPHWLAIFTVWRLGPVAWQLSPTHACQGVGCRY